MPNHAHFLFSLKGDTKLSDLMKAWKGASARAVGRVAARSMADGCFWQKDYFDRLVRDREHFWNCVRYIRDNSRQAGLREEEFKVYLSEEVRAVLE